MGNLSPVIIFMHNLAPTGGIERDAIKCIRALADQGRELHIGVSFLHPEARELLHGNIHWHRIPTVKRPPVLGQWVMWRQMLHLERRLKHRLPNAKSIAFEWIPACDFQIGGQPPRLWWKARKEMGLRTWHRPTQRAWEQFVERTLIDRGSHFLTYSELGRRAFLEIGVAQERVTRVLIPTDTSFFAPEHNKKRTDILIVGANPTLKGIDLALAAWPEIHRRHPDLRLNIVTQGWKVRRLANRLDLPAVKLSPLVSDPREYYRRSRIVLAPSRFETWCNVVPEALACGVPVITSRQTPSSELVTSPWLGAVINRTASLQTDTAALVEAVDNLLESNDPPSVMMRRHDHVQRFQSMHLTLTDWIRAL